MNLLSHVALLVPSVERSAQYLKSHGLEAGPAEEWPGEGTLEIYVGPTQSQGRLLLMQPLREGAYTRAMSKRGPGLHHIAIDVEDAEVFAGSIASSGWLLHPKSISTFQKSKTLWLARPGAPSLIEVHGQGNKIENPSTSFISRLELPRFDGSERMISALRTPELGITEKHDCQIRIENFTFSLNKIIQG